MINQAAPYCQTVLFSFAFSSDIKLPVAASAVLVPLTVLISSHFRLVPLFISAGLELGQPRMWKLCVK